MLARLDGRPCLYPPGNSDDLQAVKHVPVYSHSRYMYIGNSIAYSLSCAVEIYYRRFVTPAGKITPGCLLLV